MVNFFFTLLLSAVMGLSILLTFPLILWKKIGEYRAKFLSAIAVGILIFLIADVFSDAGSIIYNGSFYGYGSLPLYDLIFFISLVAGFTILYFVEVGYKKESSQYRLSFIIALGIGFQNLTEGLVFGTLNVSIGFTSITLVVLVGFILQNLTEGFPIASPFIGKENSRPEIILGMLLIGGLPTIIGSAFGFFYSSETFTLFFEGLAIGSMLYVILPILKRLLRDSEAATSKIAYVGAFLGFSIGFIVNLF